MVACFIAFAITITLIIEVVPARTQGQFPLKDCINADIDTLALVEDDGVLRWQGQHEIISGLHNEIWKYDYGDGYQRMGAVVVDQWSAHHGIINVSDWSLSPFFNDWNIYRISNTEQPEMPAKDLWTLLEKKIQFVERLFEEMSNIRKIAIHIGILFLDGTNLTREDIRNVSSIVQQRQADVKIFIVIFGSKLVNEVVFLTDTIVLPNLEFNKYHHHLLMAMCKTCGKDWRLFEHPTSLTISCFKILTFLEFGIHWVSWNEAINKCKNKFETHLAVIETDEEMLFLKNYISEVLKEKNVPSADIAIGLRTDLRNYAKRFQWVITQETNRPLLTNRWLPGKPSTGTTNTGCGVWKFVLENNVLFDKSKNTYFFINSTVEGWADVECQTKVNPFVFPLCEIVLPQRVSDSDFIIITPTPENGINSVLKMGPFLTFHENIVSVPANVASQEFLQFLRESKKDFPLFDCGEDASDGRYISYTLVCDFVDHCSNKRDELSCLKPHEQVESFDNYCLSGQRQHIPPNRCDNVKDCIDGNDEKNCVDHYCNSVRCYDGSCLPLHWVNDGEFDCLTYKGRSKFFETDESPQVNMHLLKNKTCALICNRENCTELSQLNDEKIDCDGPEGPLDETIGKLKASNTCKNILDEFVWAPLCHYIKDRYGGVIGCRDMSHLRDCEDFHCGQGYVKCPNSYCIPQHYLRDGKVDCPTGKDEIPFYIGPCHGNFACWNSEICLDPDLVCNGHPDCPHGDDEFDCCPRDDGKIVCTKWCPDGLRCVAGTVTLVDYKRLAYLGISSLPAIKGRIRYLDLSGGSFYLFNKFIGENIKVFQNLQVLILSNCSITEFYLPCTFDGVSEVMIKKLDISHNMIDTIFKCGNDERYKDYLKYINYLNVSFNTQFVTLKYLRLRFLEILDLSYTGISYLDESVFVGLPKLRHLNLSHTLISDFSRQYFPKELTLMSLDLRGILIKDFHSYFFRGLTISHSLYTDNFQICCPQIKGLTISAHACVAPVDAISTCFHLIGLEVQRVLLWLAAVFATLGNTTVIVYRVIWDRSVLKIGYGLFVTNLGVSDFIMGVYLFIIAGADHFYRDNYVLYDKTWRNSVVCKFAGFMACLSCEASTFFVFLITFDRFLVMKFPFGQIKFSRFTKSIVVTVSWAVSILLALVPIVFSFEIYSSNPTCIGLPLTNTHVKGWDYSVGVFVIFNFIMFLFIAYGQYAIFRSMSENRISKTGSSMSRSRRAEEIIVAKQLSLVVVSNFLFWFPVGLMGLMSLGGHEVSNEVYAWTTVLFLPINSAVNPVLYTIPALMAKWEKFKHRDQRTLSTSI